MKSLKSNFELPRFRSLSQICFAAIFFLLLCNPAPADDSCQTRDFRAQLGPIRDQSDSGWCFAYVAADLLTQRTSKRISAADLATSFLLVDSEALKNSKDPEIQKYLAANPYFYQNLYNGRNNAQTLLEKITNPKNDNGDLSEKEIATKKGIINAGGDAAATILLANIRGLCLEKDFPSNDNYVLKSLDMARKEWQAIEAKNPKISLGGLPSDPTSGLTDAGSEAIMNLFAKAQDKKCHRSPLSETIIPVSYAVNLAADYPKGSAQRHTVQEKMMTELDKALDGYQAVGIRYNAYTLIARQPEDLDDGSHEGIIVGRKLIAGTCYYLLRNSWGGDCDGTVAKFYQRCVKEKGDIWMTRDEVENRDLFGVSYIKYQTDKAPSKVANPQNN